MRIFRHYRDIPGAFQGAVVAVGNFDGVHLGHRALIAEAARAAVADRRAQVLEHVVNHGAHRPPRRYAHLDPLRTNRFELAGF